MNEWVNFLFGGCLSGILVGIFLGWYFNRSNKRETISLLNAQQRIRENQLRNPNLIANINAKGGVDYHLALDTQVKNVSYLSNKIHSVKNDTFNIWEKNDLDDGEF